MRPNKNRRRLILVRHARPVFDRHQPPTIWPLSEDGYRRAMALERRLKPYRPYVICSSLETKARQTAQAIAEQIDQKVLVVEDLHEHDRSGVGWFESQAEFDAAVRKVFTQPDNLVFGNETGSQALDRFDRAVHKLLAAYLAQNVLVATHGTVMTLFIARYNAVDPLDFWQKLTMPAYVVLTVPDFQIGEVYYETR